ncbi:hypothetical protein E8E14_008556 [Neopestalotiopsis sp. 37M]|nr:hypothetical protein E8E14_008556 [Neopestalotiopsis sp. 37M]
MDDSPPPPYSPSAPTSANPSSELRPSGLTDLDSQIHLILAHLPHEIQQNQQAHNERELELDIRILDQVRPAIKEFLQGLCGVHPTPSQASLALLPRAAVPADAQCTEFEEMSKRGEIGRVVRLDIAQELGDGDMKTTKGPRFDNKDKSTEQDTRDRKVLECPGTRDASPSLLWWSNEEFAKRLVAHLGEGVTMPASAPSTASSKSPVIKGQTPSPIHMAQETPLPENTVRRNWRARWLSRSATPSTSHSNVSAESDPENNVTAVDKRLPDRLVMKYDARIVTFRHENEFGIFESTSGWALVATVHFQK